MVKWEGIEDTSPLPTRVWLSRTKLEDETAKNEEEWKPLRKVDCKRLNDDKSRSVQHGHLPVLIESGRATADPDFGIIRANFVPRPLRELTSCTWFVVATEKKDPQTGELKPLLEPMPDAQAELVEDVYQRAIFAASVYGEGIEPLLKEKFPLGEGVDAHVEVCREAGSYLLRKVPNGWFSKSFKLQRGHGSYTVEGEEEEELLGPINQVVFVVHGIGENWFSKDKSLSMVEVIRKMRLAFQKRQIAFWKEKCEQAKKKKEPIPDPPNRVEFLPILWYDRLHNKQNAMTKSLMAVTPNSIPALRQIANDVVLDVLLYMTPNYCKDVLESVTDQIYSVYGVFSKTFPDFKSRGGKCSLIGHSLGSVICWDLLSLKKKSLAECNREHEAQVVTSATASNAANIGLQQQSTMPEIETVRSFTDNDFGGGAWGPSLPCAFDRVIPFEPEFTMFMGSPLGLFLSLRGAHAVFDSIRDASPDKPRASPFTLPTKAVYNIFSPSDPVAYRIEPLLLEHGTEDFPDPEYLTRLGEGVRIHIKVAQFVAAVPFFLGGKKSVQAKAPEESSTRSKEKPIDAGEDDDDDDKMSEDGKESDELRFPLGGKSMRLDYQLQKDLVDLEYVKAVNAHSTYFENNDVIDFIIDITALPDDDDDKDDEVIDLTADDEDDYVDVKGEISKKDSTMDITNS